MRSPFRRVSEGFEIETELTVHALELRMPFAEVPVPLPLPARGLGEQAVDLPRRLAHPQDDLQAVHERAAAAVLPGIAGLLVLVSLILAQPMIATYLATGLVPRLPTAVLATG